MDIEKLDIKIFLEGENGYSDTMQDCVLRFGVQIQKDYPNPLDSGVCDLRMRRLAEVKKEFDTAMGKEAARKWLQRLRDHGFPKSGVDQIVKDGMARAYPTFNLIQRAFNAGIDIPFGESQDGKVYPYSRPNIMEAIKKREKDRYSSPELDCRLATIEAIGKNLRSMLQPSWGCELAPVEQLSKAINSYINLYFEKRSSADEIMQFASYIKGRTDLIASQNPPLPDEDNGEFESDEAE